jgi:hypothetical protein
LQSHSACLQWDQLLGALHARDHRQRLFKYYLRLQEERSQPVRAIDMLGIVNAPLVHVPSDPICAILILGAYRAAHEDLLRHHLDIDEMTDRVLAPFRADPVWATRASKPVLEEKKVLELTRTLVEGELGPVLGDLAKGFRAFLRCP